MWLPIWIYYLVSSLIVTIFYLGGRQWAPPISSVSIFDHFNSIFSNGINHVIDIIVWIFITLAKAYFFPS
jgi:hypothetical protein